MTFPKELIDQLNEESKKRSPIPRYFNKESEPIGLGDWMVLIEDRDYAIVKKTTIGEVEISTVWLGIDHSFGLSPNILIFETMVFGGPCNQEQDRYSTLEEALKGHEHYVAKVKRYEQ
jgi:hypothetical protein